jgi:glycine cleavage system H protein
MPSPSDRRFTDSHEWILLEEGVATIGLTQFAANELTDITYVEMQSSGTAVNSGDSLGEVESVKTTSDVYSPFGGEIIEVNETLSDDPSLVNSDPFASGWLVKVRVADDSGLEGLMDQSTYDEKYPVA